MLIRANFEYIPTHTDSTHGQLEFVVCGDAKVDIAFLQRHTMYQARLMMITMYQARLMVITMYQAS